MIGYLECNGVKDKCGTLDAITKPNVQKSILNSIIKRQKQGSKIFQDIFIVLGKTNVLTGDLRASFPHISIVKKMQIP